MRTIHSRVFNRCSFGTQHAQFCSVDAADPALLRPYPALVTRASQISNAAQSQQQIGVCSQQTELQSTEALAPTQVFGRMALRGVQIPAVRLTPRRRPVATQTLLMQVSCKSYHWLQLGGWLCTASRCKGLGSIANPKPLHRAEGPCTCNAHGVLWRCASSRGWLPVASGFLPSAVHRANALRGDCPAVGAEACLNVPTNVIACR